MEFDFSKTLLSYNGTKVSHLHYVVSQKMYSRTHYINATYAASVLNANNDLFESS